MYLFNDAFDAHLGFLIQDKFLNFWSSSFNTILGTFQSNLLKQKLGLVTDKIKLDNLNNLALKCYHQDDNATQAD